VTSYYADFVNTYHILKKASCPPSFPPLSLPSSQDGSKSNEIGTVIGVLSDFNATNELRVTLAELVPTIPRILDRLGNPEVRLRSEGKDAKVRKWPPVGGNGGSDPVQGEAIRANETNASDEGEAI
jgi:hypothetical protein